MNKLELIVCISLIGTQITAMEKTEEGSKETRQTASCLIFIDSSHSEVSSYKKIQPLTFSLITAIRSKQFPIIVNFSLLANFLSRKKDITDSDHPENQVLERIELDDTWNAYALPKYDFILLLPKEYPHKQGFDLKNASDVSQFVKNRDQFSGYLKKHFSSSEPKIDISRSKEVISFFKKSSQYPQEKLPTWNIIIAGHGGMDEQIIGLPIKEAQRLLTYFNEIPMGTMLLISCYIGGKTGNLLRFKTIANNEKILRELNYILIVMGSSDSTTHLLSGAIEKLHHDFFEKAALLGQGKGKLLDDLLQSINIMNTKMGNPYGSDNIPQVWLPGALGFQTFNINNAVLTLGTVLLEKHKQEKQPITIQNKNAILLYPFVINVPLIISPQQQTDCSHKTCSVLLEESLFPNKNLLPPEWDRWPNSLDNIIIAKFHLIKRRIIFQRESDINLKKEKTTYPAHTLVFDLLAKNEPVLKDVYLFPRIISMARSASDYNYSHYIASITLNAAQAELGIYSFIRDSFLLIGKRKSINKFYIDEITGHNDFSLVLESAIYKKLLDASNAFRTALKPYDGKNITVKNVTIITKSSSGYELPFILIHFSLEDSPTVWSYKQLLWKLPSETITKEGMLQFNPLSQEESKNYMQQYRQNIDSLKQHAIKTEGVQLEEQKRIPEVLEHKTKILKEISAILEKFQKSLPAEKQKTIPKPEALEYKEIAEILENILQNQKPKKGKL